MNKNLKNSIHKSQKLLVKSKTSITKIIIIISLILMITTPVFAGQIIVKNGQLNMSNNLIINSNTFYVNSATGNVGIGTLSPSSELTVIGNGNFTGTAYINSNQEVCTAENELCGTATTGGGWNISGTDIILATTTNNVGIGTINPTQKLHVQGNLNVTGTVYATAFVGDGSGITNIGLGSIPDAWVNITGDTMNGTLTFSGSTANIALGSNWLSGDGEDEGIYVGSSGDVTIGLSASGLVITSTGIISDANGNIVLNDQVDIGSATTGLRVTTDGAISDIDDGNVTINDDLTVTGKIYGDGSELTGITSGGNDGTGGWTNTSTVTTTDLIVNITSNLIIGGDINYGNSDIIIDY